MSRLKHLLFASLVCAAACAPTPPEPARGAAQGRVAELWTDETRTILDGEAARALARQCSRISPGPVDELWTPSEADVEAVEDALILLVARELSEAGESPSPGGYYRQYAGFVVNGRRILYVNGVDKSAIERDPNPDRPFDWRTQAVQICDGGTITFGVEADPATQRFSNFAFNGSV